MTDKERFNGKCPYTDKPCETFKCEGCAVEDAERKFVEYIDSPGADLVFCDECDIALSCGKWKKENIDGCRNGKRC